MKKMEKVCVSVCAEGCSVTSCMEGLQDRGTDVDKQRGNYVQNTQPDPDR